MEIKNYREQPPGSNIVAIFDLYSPKTTETRRQIKLMKSKAGSHFLSFPSFSIEDEQGKKNWHAYSEFAAEKQKEFCEAIFEALLPFVRGGIVRYQKKY